MLIKYFVKCYSYYVLVYSAPPGRFRGDFLHTGVCMHVIYNTINLFCYEVSGSSTVPCYGCTRERPLVATLDNR